MHALIFFTTQSAGFEPKILYGAVLHVKRRNTLSPLSRAGPEEGRRIFFF